MDKYYVYILKSEVNGRLYTGQTNNLKERVQKHNKGNIKTTKSNIPYRLCYFEKYDSRKDAMYREWELKKRWNTDRKLKLIKSFDRSKIVNLGL